MTNKVYKTAMGKPIDLGALQLQNETVRAVGNMNVNARGDVINHKNQVIDQKNRQVRRQYAKQTNVSNTPTTGGTVDVKRARQSQQIKSQPPVVEDDFSDLPEDNDVVAETIQEQSAPEMSALESSAPDLRGGLAAAIAKSRTVTQQLEKTPRQLAKESPIKKI